MLLSQTVSTNSLFFSPSACLFLFTCSSHLSLLPLLFPFHFQNGGPEDEKDADGKSGKVKRRPRPEPLFIPPPKPGTFIAPSVYSSITPYQSHLRSPVRMGDGGGLGGGAQAMPPYTPPPILSPVREGSGLYFSTFLSNAAAAVAAGSHTLPPVATPKSATRSLLRSSEPLFLLLFNVILNSFSYS